MKEGRPIEVRSDLLVNFVESIGLKISRGRQASGTGALSQTPEDASQGLEMINTHVMLTASSNAVHIKLQASRVSTTTGNREVRIAELAMAVKVEMCSRGSGGWAS